MLPSGKGGIRLFKAFGIQVYLHWTWFIIAVWQYQRGKTDYNAPIWMAWEYLSLFGIVLLHEFGHSLACRSVGGYSNEIILWPLGGIAFAQPPPRAGATLWTVAAGPLVNVMLVPVIFLLQAALNIAGASGDAREFLGNVGFINLGLLIFNILPIYPLDGGQILQSLLWFKLGQAKSLLISAGFGIVASGAIAIGCLIYGQLWLGMMSLFLASQAWQGFQAARQWIQVEKQRWSAPPEMPQ